jgi:ferredoxin
MNSRLYYFSATGNTKFVADRLKEQFNRFGKSLELINIEDEEEVDLKGCEYLIIGTPVHSELPPRLLTDFVNKLPHSEQAIKCLVYSTQGASGSVSTEFLKNILVQKGYNVLIQTSFRMANSYYFGFGVERTDKEIEDYCKKVEEKAKLIAEKLLKEENHKEGAAGVRVMLGKAMSNGFYKMLPRLSRNLSSTEECTKCGLCVRNCPRNNITLEEGHAVFHSSCIICARCIHVCPVNAIRYKSKKINQNQKKLMKCLELK